MAAFMQSVKFLNYRPFLGRLVSDVCKTATLSSQRYGSIRFIHRASSASAVPSLKSTEIAYPPVTPRWPPGFWGELDESRAWELYNQSAEIEDITNLWEKVNKLTETEQFFFDIKPFYEDSPPRLLPFQKFLTKTHLITNQLPTVYDELNVDAEVAILRAILQTELAQEVIRVKDIYRELQSDPTKDISDNEIDSKVQNTIICCIMNKIIDHLKGSTEHLLSAQVDEKSMYEAFWSVGGLREEMEESTDDGFVNLQYSHKPDLTVRVDLPLPAFVNVDDEVCKHPDVITDWYHIPKVYEIGGSNHNGQFNPGYLYKTPFNDGCPAEFNQLTVTCAPDTKALRENYSQSDVSDLMTGGCLMSAFGSCLTQAYSQGFSWFNDITYPITSQSIVFDGENITFSVYQMNTLTLWKVGDKGIPHNNVCWTQSDVPLFNSSIKEDSFELNDEALRLLIKFLKLKPQERGINMRPYLSEKPSDVEMFMNRIDEPVMEKPHPPRLYSKSKKVKLVSPIVVTREKIDKKYSDAGKYWDKERGRFVSGKIDSRSSNRIRKNDS